ncbi:MAG: PEGA domain-containing protein [Planctomycetia bacterium]|nr:PEGA domain-containing protein [Planctomycetia bacterium]
MVRRHGLLRCGAALLGMAVALGQTGCVKRRYTIRTDPPGATVIVNNEEIGRTPVSRSFTFYGDRDITLILDGYKTQRVIQPIPSVWYDNYLTEVFTENFLPFTLRDEREFTYKMQPDVAPPYNDVLNRGERLRSQARVIPPPRRGGILGFFGF